MMNTAPPLIETYGRFDVARDDLLPGGTKSRYIGVLFEGCEELVYASPVQGAAQIAIAIKARELGKRATIFCAARKKRHAHTEVALSYGARMVELSFGMFSAVSAAARKYVEQTSGARLAPFGLRVPESIDALTRACLHVRDVYQEVWCAAGSGTLATALCAAFPLARVVAVSVGHKLKPEEVGRAAIIVYGVPFDKPAPARPPFPCNMTYDAKAWDRMLADCRAERALFWNVDREHS